MGRAPCCDKANVKKGPWSPEEDAKLKSFIEQNGTGGNWITLPSKAGLKRCGKSCRLRWINYLRPDIKHGSFTEDEEKTIYRLHAQIGSRWSLIAAQLPGRTDNDIKNYWNTRLKKKLLERGNAAAAHYGRLHPYQQIPAHLFNQLGLQDQMASAAAREGLLHGQHSYSMNQQSYYQLYQHQQYLQQQMQHQHHQLVQDPNQTVHLPTVLQHQMNMRSIKNEMVDEHHHQQRTLVAPTNGAVDEAERERLMVIESSLRSIIVTDEAATGGGSSRRLPVNNMGAVHSMQARVGNPMSPVTLAAHHNVSSPTSSCSNLSSDRNSFGVQNADSAFSDAGYNAYDDGAPRDPAANMLNTSILDPQPQVSSLQNPASAPGSLLAAPRFDDGVLFGEDLGVYNRSQGLSEIAVVDRVKDDAQAGGGGGHGGEWWNIDLVSPPRHNVNPTVNSSSSRAATILPTSMKWPIPTPRCGAENIYASPQTQLASQSHGPQPLDAWVLSGFVEILISRLAADKCYGHMPFELEVMESALISRTQKLERALLDVEPRLSNSSLLQMLHLFLSATQTRPDPFTKFPGLWALMEAYAARLDSSTTGGSSGKGDMLLELVQTPQDIRPMTICAVYHTSPQAGC